MIINKDGVSSVLVCRSANISCELGKQRMIAHFDRPTSSPRTPGISTASKV
jgi:hypothetical protein